MDKRRVDSNQDFEAVNDVCELVWENGQIMTTQGQSSRLRRDPTDHTLPSHTPKLSPAARPGKLGTLVGSVMTNIDEDDDDDDDMMIPWLNYPMDCPDFLPELSGVTVNEIPKASCDVAADAIKPRTGPSQLYSASSLPSFRSRVDNGFAPSVRTQKLDAVPLGASASVANFSHFSRPAALGSLQRMPGIEKVSNCKDKGGPRIGIVESKRLEGIKPVEDLRAEAAGKGIASTNAMNSNQVAAESTTRGLPLGEKNAEPVVASSSVCSGNSVERSSDGPTDVLKRKFRDTEDSECHSEDADEDSVGVKKIGLPRASGSKRSRAAEVHNLSERRRRDRINEKMRALQELIPNCNKVDKASMLDEAIEYLKTLQLQVQMMSMGAGLCMPQMMMSHMTHFSPMGFGMGMGMGFGMGIPDMSGATSPGYPVMQGPHFPGPPPMPGHAGLQVYGLPGQGVSMPMQRPPMLPMMGGPFMRPGLSLNTNSGQPYVNQTSSQCRTTSVAFEKPPSVQNNIQQPSEANMSNASPPGLPP